MSTKKDSLSHHGIKGQKWGVKNGPPYPLDGSKRISHIPKMKNKLLDRFRDLRIKKIEKLLSKYDDNTVNALKKELWNYYNKGSDNIYKKYLKTLEKSNFEAWYDKKYLESETKKQKQDRITDELCMLFANDKTLKKIKEFDPEKQVKNKMLIDQMQQQIINQNIQNQIQLQTQMIVQQQMDQMVQQQIQISNMMMYHYY